MADELLQEYELCTGGSAKACLQLRVTPWRILLPQAQEEADRRAAAVAVQTQEEQMLI